jgi:hypothetical protein
MKHSTVYCIVPIEDERAWISSVAYRTLYKSHSLVGRRLGQKERFERAFLRRS